MARPKKWENSEGWVQVRASREARLWLEEYIAHQSTFDYEEPPGPSRRLDLAAAYITELGFPSSSEMNQAAETILAEWTREWDRAGRQGGAIAHTFDPDQWSRGRSLFSASGWWMIGDGVFASPFYPILLGKPFYPSPASWEASPICREVGLEIHLPPVACFSLANELKEATGQALGSGLVPLASIVALVVAQTTWTEAEKSPARVANMDRKRGQELDNHLHEVRQKILDARTAVTSLVTRDDRISEALLNMLAPKPGVGYPFIELDRDLKPRTIRIRDLNDTN